MLARTLLFSLILALLAACDPAPTANDTRKPAAAERDQALNRAIQAPQDKARAVEDELQQDQQRKRDAIDAAGG